MKTMNPMKTIAIVILGLTTSLSIMFLFLIE